jgi:sugar phosphate isomerase/epimerase
MRLRSEHGHLTYCTNIHAADSWPDVLAGLREHLPEIKATVSRDSPFGVGLRVSASASEALKEPAALAELRSLLDEGDYYIFTINGFPYGAFHGEPVKQGAYRPDWGDPARLSYSNDLADLLAALLPNGIDEGSVSTVPCTFKPWANDELLRAIVDNLINHVAHLTAVQERTGKTVVLALEPEPYCLLETIEEAVAFFKSHLLGVAAVARLSGLTGMSQDDALAALKRHLGLCYDVCHAAVEFEDARASLKLLRDADIKIAKVQLSSALRIPNVSPATLGQLKPFDEPVYLHQVVQRKGGRLKRYMDMVDAFAAFEDAADTEWRIHFHVPIFLDSLKDFGTTQEFLKEILAIHRESPITNQLEVETYTWDVLPERYRDLGVAAAIAREISWVMDELER